jgi:Xaa-Pro aminopeptidase
MRTSSAIRSAAIRCRHRAPATFSHIFLPTADWTLEEGMVFHMSVSAGGIAISETVLVTKAGHERLTRSLGRVFQV